MPRVEVTVTSLELTAPEQLKPSRRVPELSVRLVFPPVGALNRRYYEEVGRQWHWRDRLKWSEDDWGRYLATPGVQTWEFLLNGEPGVGYAELATDAKGSTEIVYFGLLPAHIGHGLGGDALTRMVEIAWAIPSKRVWLHTCTFDAPMAIVNYEARGFKRFKSHAEWREVAE